MKKTILMVALLLGIGQWAWADEVKYIEWSWNDEARTLTSKVKTVDAAPLSVVANGSGWVELPDGRATPSTLPSMSIWAMCTPTSPTIGKISRWN